MLSIVIAAWMLSGCSSGTQPMPAPSLPVSDMITCPDLPPARSGALSDLWLNHLDVAEAYHDCKRRQQALADWIKSNNKQ